MTHFSAVLSVFLLVLSAGACQAQTGRQPAPEKISELGRYEGYSEPIYTEYVRESVHVPMRDGVKLAVDVYRPAINGKAVETPMPVLFSYSRYRRSQERPDGSILSQMGVLPPGKNSAPLEWSWEKRGLFSITTPYLVAHGYVFAQADARGTGASFGVYKSAMTKQEAEDGYDLVEWLAAQPFASGKVGMIGRSYLGQTQYLTLSEAPPSLKAAFPAVALMDAYQFSFSGAGVFRKAEVSWVLRQLYNDALLEGEGGGSSEVSRVDADTDGSMLKAAYAERQAAAGSWSLSSVAPPRIAAAAAIMQETLGLESIFDVLTLMVGPTDRLADALKDHPELAEQLAEARVLRDEGYDKPYDLPDGSGSLSALLPKIKATDVPTYHFGGWLDAYVDGTVLWHNNVEGPSKLIVGPWTHHGDEADGDVRERASRRVQSVEHLRWFDYWLKGIDNGIMAEPAVGYAVVQSPSEWRWRQSESWPPEGSKHVPFYFTNEQSGSVDSVNDGGLSMTSPTPQRVDSFRVDYTATMGQKDRYYDGVGSGPIAFPDLAAHAKTALTYTSAPLDEDVVIAGHPIVRLQATSTAEDGDFLVYLEEVDADGTVHYVTDGLMRASHRALGAPPYEYLGMPWSDSSSAAVAATGPLNKGPVALEFPLMPVANRFEKGHRIRVVVTGADADGTLTIPRFPTPEQKLVVGGAKPSFIELPVMPTAN